MPEIVKQVQAILPGFEQGVQDRKAAEKARRKTKQESRGKLAVKDEGFDENEVTPVVYGIRYETAQRGQDFVQIGTMPKLYQDLFGLSGPVYVSNSHLYRDMVSKETAIKEGRYKPDSSADYHDLGEEKIINAIMQFGDPIAIMESLKDFREPRLVSVLYEKGSDQQNLIGVLELYRQASVPGGHRRNHVLFTIYEKSNLPEYIDLTIGKNRMLYIKEGLPSGTLAGVQFAGKVPQEALNKNVAQFKKKVNDFKTANKISYSIKDESSLSDREILANTLMEAAQNPGKERRLANYKNQLETFYKTQDELEIAEARLRQARHTGDQAKILEAQRERDRLSAKLTKIDSKLLELKATKPLKELLTRVKADTRTRTRTLARERRSKMELRTKIRRLHEKMSTELLKPREGRYVPKGLLKTVAEVLEAVNTHCFVSMNSSQARFSAFGKAFLSFSEISSLSVRTWVSLLSNARISSTASGSM